MQIIISIIGGMLLGFTFCYYPVMETKTDINYLTSELNKCEENLKEIKAINKGMFMNK